MSIIYDKLKHMETDEKYFDFICPHCKTDAIKKDIFEIKPIGISYRPDIIDNSDIDNEILRNGYDKLPILGDAIIEAVFKHNYKGILVHCKKCNLSVGVYETINIPDIKKWVNKHIKNYMIIKKNGR